MKLRTFVLSLAVFATGVLGVSRPAHATIVERIVAVVGDRAVLWTELLRRAVGPRLQIRAQTQDPNVISVQEQEMYKDQQAQKAHVSVTPQEIDRGIANIAAQAQASQGRPVTVDDVMDEMRHRGFRDADFRDEIRRQILEGKLIELRVRPRVRVTEQDGLEQYQRMITQLRDSVDLRTIALRMPPGATDSQLEAKMKVAYEIQRAANVDKRPFCELVREYSENAATRDTCGSQGPKRITELLQPIADAVRKLPEGVASDPLPIQLGADQVILVVSWVAPKAPPYSSVKNEMMQQALVEGLERERKRWLQELRQSIYIDVRL
jgi:peptidyl-prolyl cis-trans isomerase SurA